MSIIDASVAVKWFVQESDSDRARALLADRYGALHVPDICVVEVSSALVRIANADKVRRDMARQAIAHLIDLIDAGALIREPMMPGQVAEAARLAMDLGHPLKDCVYLALAMDQARDLITADARFAAKARNVYAGVRDLSD